MLFDNCWHALNLANATLDLDSKCSASVQSTIMTNGVMVFAGGCPMLDSDKPGSSVVEIQCLLDNVGASELVIDLIVNTKNDRVFEESILLGIALLQGGNTQIQVGSQMQRLK